MRIVIFTHPAFTVHQSMPRYAKMLADGLRTRGHTVEIYSPDAYFSKLPAPAFLKKWLGYIDQFLIFPAIIKKRVGRHNQALYVFSDHALGMWVPIVKHLPHVIICHDFLAQRSAAREIIQNQTGKTGRLYQKLIRKGYSQGKNFISVSKKTQQDLHRFLGFVPPVSKVLYNGLNNTFVPLDVNKSRQAVGKAIGIDVLDGYILHIGGNQWYKNRSGVVKIYNAWRAMFNNALPLLLIGLDPASDLKQAIETSPHRNDIFPLADITDDNLNSAYSGASVLLFPSLAEGFGWPIAEAMASGCPVVTTNEAPMTEVGADAAIYIHAEPLNVSEKIKWAEESAKVLNDVIIMEDQERLNLIGKGVDNSRRFNTDAALDKAEKIFFQVWSMHHS